MIVVAEVFNYFFLAFYSAEFLIKIALQLGEVGLGSPPGHKRHRIICKPMGFARETNDFHLV